MNLQIKLTEVLPRTALLIAGLAIGGGTYSAEPTDPGSSRLRALGVEDEPSLAVECGGDNEAIRLVDYAQSRVRALVRVNKDNDRINYTFRSFERGSETEEVTHILSGLDWQSLVDGLDQDSFWIMPATVTTWRPDGLRWMLEACLSGRYRMHTLDPDFEFRMNDLVEKMVALKDSTARQSAP